MRKILTFVFLFLFIAMANMVQAQKDEPRFPGCDDPTDVDCADLKMMQFLYSNVNHPDNNPGGEVVIGFTVKASGELADFEVLESVRKDCDDEVIRVLKLMPKWLPAEADGAPVDMEWEVVVKFKPN